MNRVLSSSFFRRVLSSPPAIDLATTEGKQLFKEALDKGTVEGFFKLHSSFQTQAEPAFCGLATLSMVFNALAIDPMRTWKGPWRWFDESMLGCCEPLEKVIVEGITFNKAVCLARCAGAKVEAFHSDKSSLDEFRRHIKFCTSSDNSHVVTSYHRGPFEQSGAGHFSPIGGYHPERDMVLILDVARFKYPSHWVPLALLWQAMDTIDESTGHHRGFMIVSKLPKTPSLHYTWSCKHESWLDSVHYLLDDVHVNLRLSTAKNVEEVISSVTTSFPASFAEFMNWIEVRRQKEPAIKNEVLQQVRESELYKHMSMVHCQMWREVQAMFLLALPPRIWSVIKDHNLLQVINNLFSLNDLPLLLREEVLNMRWQLDVLKREHHDSKKSISGVSEPDVAEFRGSPLIHVSSSDVNRPVTSFEDCGFSAQIIDVLASNSEKMPWLLERLPGLIGKGQVLVFASKKATVDEIETQLVKSGIAVSSLDGRKRQASRMETLQKFKSGTYNVLVTTDSAVRGLDIKSIKFVVNFDISKDMDTHVHRIGRTGHAGDMDGTAYTLITQDEACFAGKLVNNLNATGQNVSVELMDLAMKDARFRSKRDV